METITASFIERIVGMGAIGVGVFIFSALFVSDIMRRRYDNRRNELEAARQDNARQRDDKQIETAFTLASKTVDNFKKVTESVDALIKSWDIAFTRQIELLDTYEDRAIDRTKAVLAGLETNRELVDKAINTMNVDQGRIISLLDEIKKIVEEVSEQGSKTSDVQPKLDKILAELEHMKQQDKTEDEQESKTDE